jgi:hypothetical protein
LKSWPLLMTKKYLGSVQATPKGQQIWECLAILVALRTWVDRWRKQRVNLRIRGDNVGSLLLALKMRPSSPQQAIVARVIALLMTEASFPPDILHTPGAAHIVADLLSRVFAPGGLGEATVFKHPALAHSVRRQVPRRSRDYYRAFCA